MRFITRSLMGLMLITLTLALLALAASNMFNAYKDKNSSGFGKRQTRERVFTVEVEPIQLGSHFPEITTFGEVISGRSLELRATAGGELVQLSPDFREGGIVSKDDILFQTDPANALSRLLISQNELAEAEADLIDAKRNLILAEDEIKAAESQLALRIKAMKRQDSLRKRGVGTDTAMEGAELAVSGAEQSLLSKRLSLANAQAKIARSETLRARRKINVDEASRLLADTTVSAEFDGVVSEVSAVLGRLANANEKLGILIDPTALEVSFRVSSQEFRALSDTPTGLQQSQVQVSLGEEQVVFAGQIDRVSAAVGQGKTGRELFAKINNAPEIGIQPGDFVTVTLLEPALENVAKIPAAAASTNGEVLLVGDENRLEVAKVQILRKQGNFLIVRAKGLEGRQLVLARAPQLGEGIRVEPRAPGGPTILAKEMVKLDDTRRDKILKSLENNKRIPQTVRDRLIKQFQQPEVPKDVVDRIEARMALAASRGPSANTATNETGETVEITDDHRKRMIAFIKANDRIPADRKTKVLKTLEQSKVPKTVVDRITNRMGG